MKLAQMIQLLEKRRPPAARRAPHVYKSPAPGPKPRLSIILLDWNCRESLHGLDWLRRQDVPRDSYELIWIDLYHRVPEEALEKADYVVTLNQRGLYHKHKGYNEGLLLARGDLVTICDSDAVFPEDFVSSIFRKFEVTPASANADAEPRSLVLMHHELRTNLTYPHGQFSHAAELKDAARWKWRPLHPNVGACMTVRRQDAMRFGGFDEHASFRGYLCGPYDLGWRLVNAGLPEFWHDPSVLLWHFAHPDPIASNGLLPSLRGRMENTYPHVDMHALTAVENFSVGRLLPRLQHPEIHRQRLASRTIATDYEARYASLPIGMGLTSGELFRLRIGMWYEVLRESLLASIGRQGRFWLGDARWTGFKEKLKCRLGYQAPTYYAGPPPQPPAEMVAPGHAAATADIRIDPPHAGGTPHAQAERVASGSRVT